MINQFVVRVYAVIVEQNQLLVSKEQYQGQQLIKFPGGGMHFGEGPKDALKRELQEELNASLIESRLFFTPDYCIPSAFNPKDQIISLYYLTKTSWDQSQPTEHEVFWVDLKTKGETIGFTFAQDLEVFQLLQQQFI